VVLVPHDTSIFATFPVPLDVAIGLLGIVCDLYLCAYAECFFMRNGKGNLWLSGHSLRAIVG